MRRIGGELGLPTTNGLGRRGGTEAHHGRPAEDRNGEDHAEDQLGDEQHGLDVRRFGHALARHQDGVMRLQRVEAEGRRPDGERGRARIPGPGRERRSGGGQRGHVARGCDRPDEQRGVVEICVICAHRGSRERQRLPTGIHQPIVQARVRGSHKMIGDDQIQDECSEHITDHHDERRNCGDAHRVALVRPGRVHFFTIL